MKLHKSNLWKSILSSVMLLATGCSINMTDPTLSAPTSIQPAASLPTYTPTLRTELLPTEGKIAFVHWQGKYNIYVMNTDGSDLKNLTDNLAYSMDPAWSPDGQYIAFTSHPDLISQIYIMEADGSDLKQLTFNKADSYRPAWSPDGKYIIFLSTRDGVLSTERSIPTPEVYIMNSDGSEQRRLTNNQDFEKGLSWYPKGDVLAVSVGVPAISRYSIEIYLMGLDGMIQKQLTQLGINSDPVWSPNGEFIVFSSLGRDGCSGINVMKADGSNQVCLTINKVFPPVQNLAPSWSPDAKYIIFSSNLDGDFNIYRVEADGSNLVRLTNEPGDEMSPVWSSAQ